MTQPLGELKYGTLETSEHPYVGIRKGKSAPQAYWRVSAQPHVILRLRRIFPHGRKLPSNDFVLADSTRNAHELRWVLAMYPLRMTPTVKARLEAQATKHVEQADAVEQIQKERYAASPQDRRALVHPARDYQRFASNLALTSKSLLIADDVGLGKTCTAIDVLAASRALPALIVTLPHLCRQWMRELERFAPFLEKVWIRNGTVYNLAHRSRRRKKDNPSQQALYTDAYDWQGGKWPDVVVMSYSLLRSSWGEALRQKFKTVVFDECQELRRTMSQKYLAAQTVASDCEYKIGLSATPVYNYCDEMHAVMDVLAPDALGTLSEFVSEYGGGTGGTLSEPEALGTYLRTNGLMLRRTRKDVQRELPPLQRVPQSIDADFDAINENTVGVDLARLCEMLLATEKAERGAKMRMAEDISWKLRYATGMAKAPFVASFVELLVSAGEKVVLYGWHRDVYDVWKAYFEKQKIRCVSYTGEESVAAKDAARDEFIKSPTCNVIMISLRAGAGLDGLQHACRTVVFGELDWSPGVHEQCVGRVYRDGQADPVVAYFMVCDWGSDPVMSDVLGLKEQQQSRMMDPNAPFIEALEADPERMRKLASDYLRQRRERGLDRDPHRAPHETQQVADG